MQLTTAPPRIFKSKYASSFRIVIIADADGTNGSDSRRLKETEKIGDLLIFIRHVSLPSIALLSIVSFIIFAARIVTPQQRNEQHICLAVCIL